LRPRRTLLLVILTGAFVGFYTLAPCLDDATIPNEVFGFLWFVTAPVEQGRTIFVQSDEGSGELANVGTGIEHTLSSPINPEKPIDMTWYALGSIMSQGPSKGRSRGDDGKGINRVGWAERLRVLQEEYPLIVFSKVCLLYSARAKTLLEHYDITPRPRIIEVDLRSDAPHIKTILTRLTRGVLRGVLEAGGLKIGWSGEDEGEVIV
ncbi:hypothetical protein BKA83DRAFT_4282815, partial [Pisolithus microcarpus]